MALAKELAEKRQKSIEDIALNVAANVIERLAEVAEKGGNEYYVSVNTADENVATSSDFLELLSMLLEGVHVEVVERITFSIFKSKYLKFSW